MANVRAVELKVDAAALYLVTQSCVDIDELELEQPDSTPTTRSTTTDADMIGPAGRRGERTFRSPDRA